MITSAYPVTFHELGYAHAERECRPWYLVDREGEIGLTPELSKGDEVISKYEP